MFSKKMVFGLVALLCAGFLAGCPGTGTDLVGRWVITVDETSFTGFENVFEFRRNGQYTEMAGLGGLGGSGGGIYEVDNSVEPNVLILRTQYLEVLGVRENFPEGEEIVQYYIFELLDDGMTLRLGQFANAADGAPMTFSDDGVFEEFYTRQ